MATAFVSTPPRAAVAVPSPFGPGASSRLLFEQVRRLADPRCNVLLQGETGAGKNVVARLLHTLSRRCEAPFVHVDCASLAPSLIESELFGHERGAFSGAVRERAGRLEIAGAGTLLLDEIGELARPLQAKLLRVLEEREYERVGGQQTRALEARIVAATHVDLEEAARAGRFRPDLYYRLRVARLRVPPLRERLEDLEWLLEQARARAADALEVEAPRFEASALERLRSHRWPGNVRELFNLVEAVAIAHPGARLSAAALDGFLDDASPWSEPDPRASDASESLESVVEACGGNLARAARRLGIPRSTLRYRLGRTRAGSAEPLQAALPGLGEPSD